MRSTRAAESALVSVALALLTLGGCSGPLEPPIPAAHASDETPRRGGTLHLATFGDLTTLDPAASSDSFSGSVIRLLYAGLVDFDASGNVVPDLAAGIEEADEGRTYRFALREGVRFHDGTEVTAAEVKRSIERALHPTTPSPASSFEGIEGFAPFSAKKAPHLDGVVVEGRYALAIHLRERDATFLQLLALTTLRVTCPSAGERYNQTWAPCGAGPFKLPAGGWERSRTLTLVRNESYFRPGVPYLDTVTWELVSTQIAEGFEFARGDIDLIADLNQADTVRYQADPRWQPLGTYDPPSHIVQGDAMNTEVPPFDNVEIRRAVASAIDREHIVLLRASNLAPATKPVPTLPGYEPPPIGQTHDLAAALEHMRKAGYAFDPATGRGGWPAPVPYDTNRQGFSESTGVLVQQDLAKIGIRIALRVSSLGTWTALTHRRGKSPMSPQGWHEDYPDPRNFLEPRFGTGSIAEENGLNYSFYSNPRVDALLERARRELDPAARTALYAEVERIVCDEAPWAFEYSYRFYQVRQPYVRGYRTHAMWTSDVIPIWLDRARGTEGRSEAPFVRELLGEPARPPTMSSIRRTIRGVMARACWGGLVVWAVVTIAFALNEVVPSDPARMVAGPQARPEEVARVREELGLDRPVAARYAIFLSRLAHLGPSDPGADPTHASCAVLGPIHVDLGWSFVQRRPVVDVIAERLPRSAALAATAVLVQMLIGMTFGTFAAAKRRTAWDTSATVATLVGASIPTFVVGLSLQYVLGYKLRWLPLDGFGRTTAAQARAIILPALALGLFGAAYATRLVRDEVSAALTLDYARTARAKGASPARVLIHHALRNALAPVVTLAGIDLGALVGGAIVVETLFRWPGLGAASVNALLDRDGPLVLGTLLVTSSAVVVANVVVDMVLRLLDPRVGAG